MTDLRSDLEKMIYARDFPAPLIYSSAAIVILRGTSLKG